MPAVAASPVAFVQPQVLSSLATATIATKAPVPLPAQAKQPSQAQPQKSLQLAQTVETEGVEKFIHPYQAANLTRDSVEPNA